MSVRAPEKVFRELELLLNNIDVQVWSLTREDTYGAVNRAHADFMGKPPESLAYRPIAEFLEPDVVAVCLESNRAVFRDRTPAITREWVPDAKGKRRLLAITKTPWIGPDDQVHYVICSARDVTEEEQARTALAKSEKRYRGLLNSQRQMIVRVDADGRFTFVNDAYCRAFGQPREALIGHRFQPLVHPDDLPDTLKAMEGLAQPPHRAYMEQRAKTIDGWRWIAWEDDAILDEKGCIREIHGVGRDITEEKEAAQALQRSLAAQSLLAEWSMEVIGEPAQDEDTMMDRALSRLGSFWGADRVFIFQLREDDTILDNTHEWCAPGIASQRDHLKNMRQELFPWSLPRLAAGQTIVANRLEDLPPEAEAERSVLAAQDIQSVALAPLTYRTRFLGFIGMDMVRAAREWDDETIGLLRIAGSLIVSAMQLLRTTADLKAAQAAAERAGRARAIFLANMSHEIRTPLNAILGHVQIMERAPEDSPAQARGLGVIRRSGAHLLELLDDILTISRADLGQIPLRNEPFRIADLLERVRALFEVQADTKHLRLRVVYRAPHRGWLCGDPVKIYQVLVNLVENALRHTSRGEIRMTVRPVPDKASGGTDNLWHCDVSDTGTGIERERLERIFEPFEQNGDSNHNTPGVGLGLVLSRHYARRMGGDLVARSRPGKGSRFRFTFQAVPYNLSFRPIAGRQVRQLRDAEAAPTVLVVDDDPDNRDMLVDMLSAVGFHVQTANNGGEALHRLAMGGVNAILLDKVMPGIGGVDVIRRIRGDKALRSIKVVILTASGLQGDKATMLNAGADGYIPKPLEAERLFAELQRLLGVEYIYQDHDARDDGQQPVPAPLGVGAPLYPEEKEALRKSAALGDAHALRAVAGRIQVRNPPVGVYLASLADRYDYEALWAFLNNTELENTQPNTTGNAPCSAEQLSDGRRP